VRAEAAFHDRCARVIQRAFRRYRLRDRIGQTAAAGTFLHRRWVIGKAQDASIRLANAIDRQSDAIDAMLASLDVDLEHARNVMRAMEAREKEVYWGMITLEVLERKQTECPVCLREMDYRRCRVTSCGHLFHRACLDSWLAFCESAERPPSCPVCRSVCENRTMSEDEESAEEATESAGPVKKTVKQKTERQRWH
jgi:hypothetical protein